jgi:hypothetical protein
LPLLLLLEEDAWYEAPSAVMVSSVVGCRCRSSVVVVGGDER